MPLLETKDLGIAFGGLQALDDVYITVDEKEIVGLIGPNGAGKTTVFNLLTGVYTPTKGAIRFEGKSILGRKPYQINRLGIARTFQNIRLFKNMTVMDNIKVAMNQNMRYTVEHDMSLVMGVCERIYVLDYGTLIASGTPEEIRSDEKVIKAYLGG